MPNVPPSSARHFRRPLIPDQIYSTPYSGSPLPYPPPPGASVPVTPTSTFRHAVNHETPTMRKPHVSGFHIVLLGDSAISCNFRYRRVASLAPYDVALDLSILLPVASTRLRSSHHQ